jgi:multiple sugar transport system permease protein
MFTQIQSIASALPRAGARRLQWSRLAGSILKHAILIVLSVFFLIPWAWMISTSLKSPRQLLVYPPVWIPDPIQWDNYLVAIERSGLLTYAGNTLQIAAFSVIGALISNIIAAYGFARLRWWGRDMLFAVVLATLMLPGAVTLIPLYITFRHLGWLNTYLPLIVPTFFCNPFYLFLLRQFLMTIPQELSDAARIDGCSDLGIIRLILIPLMKPALAVVALFEFTHHWNDLVGPLIYLSDKSKYTIALGIASMRVDYGMSNFAWIMAATTLSVIPIVVLFFVAQRTFIQGITLTGLRG